MAGARPPRIRYTHEGLIDMIIAEPWVSQNELALRFGYTAPWISTVMTSDAFLAKLEERKAEVVDPVLKMGLDERFKAVTTRSLEVLMEKLSEPSQCVPDNLALRAAELGAKSLGLGQQKEAQQVVAPDHLDRLADRLIALQRGLAGTTLRATETLDVEFAECR